MNRHIATSLLVLSLAIPPIAPRAEGARVTVSVSFFTSELEPWGRWVRVEPWGQVWVPGGVGPGWQPYLYGRWEMSDYGWAWVSADPWSPWTWHYGTWVPTARWGWVWVPGTVWAPAWVTWRWTDGAVGWAPVSPSFAISASGVVRSGGAVPASSYVFVPMRAFAAGEISSTRLAPSRNQALVRASTRRSDFAVRDGIVRTRGPSRERVERSAGVSVRAGRGPRIAPAPIPDAARGRGRSAPAAAPVAGRDAAAPMKRDRGPSVAPTRRRPSEPRPPRFSPNDRRPSEARPQGARPEGKGRGRRDPRRG